MVTPLEVFETKPPFAVAMGTTKGVIRSIVHVQGTGSVSASMVALEGAGYWRHCMTVGAGPSFLRASSKASMDALGWGNHGELNFRFRSVQSRLKHDRSCAVASLKCEKFMSGRALCISCCGSVGR